MELGRGDLAAIVSIVPIKYQLVNHPSSLYGGRIISGPTLSGFPATATSVPRRVYSLCEAERETESSEYGEPMTSNRASVKHKLSV